MSGVHPKELGADVVAVARRGDAPISEVAKDFGTSDSCLRDWLRAADVEDGHRPGLSTAESAELRELKRWSSRLLADHLTIGNATVARAWRQVGVQPWRAESFRFSTDPELVAKVTDVVGLYLAPPENAVVLCVDRGHLPLAGERSQIQALDRTAPALPTQPHLIERRSADYVRHGTTTLFAALEIATGHVTGALKPRHRRQEFLAFLKQVARAYPGRELYLVMDNYAAHKTPEVKDWLAATPRIVVHFTPTHVSWMNLVEVGFSIIERQAIHRGTYTPVKDLNAKIRAFIDGWNDRAHPFVWTKAAADVLKKANQETTSDTQH